MVENMDTNQHKATTVGVDEANFGSEVLKSDQPVLVVFWAPWSRPCQILDWELNEVAATCAGTARAVKVNADDNPDLSMWYEIQSVPTLLFFMNGSVRARVVGTASKAAILAKLEAVSQGADVKPFTPDGET